MLKFEAWADLEAGAAVAMIGTEKGGQGDQGGARAMLDLMMALQKQTRQLGPAAVYTAAVIR